MFRFILQLSDLYGSHTNLSCISAPLQQSSVSLLCVCVRVCFVHPDVPAPEQPELFLKKLQQCCTVFDFIDTLSDLKMKEYKRSTLNELVDYVTVSRGYLTEQAYPEVVKMVRGVHVHPTHKQNEESFSSKKRKTVQNLEKTIELFS